MKRKFLYPVLEIGSEARNRVDVFQNREYNFYGTVKSRAKHNVWNVQFDALPLDHNVVMISREHITTLYPEEDEKCYDREKDAMESIAEECSTTKKKKCKTPSQRVRDSIDAFLSLDTATQKTAVSFTHRYGPNPQDKVHWKILSDSEQVTRCPMEKNTIANTKG